MARWARTRDTARLLAGGLVACAFLVALAATPGVHAAPCTADDLNAAVESAGADLRRVNAEATPKLQARMLRLKEQRGWTNAEYESEAMALAADQRLAELDAQTGELLERIDAASRAKSGEAVDCTAVQGAQSAGLELVATIRAKTTYLLARLDAAIAAGQTAAPAPAPPPRPAAPAPTAGAGSAPAPQAAMPNPPAETRSPPPAAKPSTGWTTTTTATVSTPPGAAADAPRPGDGPKPAAIDPGAFVSPGSEDGYTIEEIREATRGFFGQISTGLAQTIEYAFSRTGRPTAYVLGSEGGGAVLAGVRYGDGTLFMRRGETRKVYWHGPSLGGDLGLSGAKTMFLIYKLDDPALLFSRFTGIEGSAYFVGGVGLTLLTNGRVVMAPIRSGVGFRLGANIGYVRFTETQTWNPF